MDDKVVYERPDCKRLREEGWNCVDMHFHSNYSDSFSGIKGILKLARERHTGVAITDHNLIQGCERAMKEKSGVFIIPGMEISSWDGPHILAYFYEFADMKYYWENQIKPYMSRSPWLSIKRRVPEILDSLEGANCVVSAAHPMGYYISYRGIQQGIEAGKLEPEMARRFDAYEITGGSMTRGYNTRARKAADEFGLGYTGGTDGHMLGELSHVVTCSKSDSVEGFLDDIRNHRTTIVGKEENIFSKAAMSTLCLTKFLRYLPSSLQHKFNHAFVKLK